MFLFLKMLFLPSRPVLKVSKEACNNMLTNNINFPQTNNSAGGGLELSGNSGLLEKIP